MNRTCAVMLVGGMVLGGMRVCADEPEKSGPSPVIARLLAASGAVAYAHKADYGAGIDSVTIGYGADGAPVVGLAARKTKTYAEALAVIAVTPREGSFVIAAAEIPEVEAFHGKSRDLTKEALKDITGKVFKDAKETRGLVDAMTGATQYYKAIYVSYALMASKVIEEISANPDWPRTALQP